MPFSTSIIQASHDFLSYQFVFSHFNGRPVDFDHLSCIMEATSINADGEVIFFYRRTQQQSTAAAPLFTIASADNGKASLDHKKLDDAFQALFGQIRVLNLTTASTSHAAAAHDQQQPTTKSTEIPPPTTTSHHLGFLQGYLSSKLAKAFSSTSANHFDAFLNCSRVSIGGFGGTWHHDATSQLTSDDGIVFDYLALYYLNDHSSTGNNSYNWLECALQTQEEEPADLIHSFCPVSTMDGQMLVLRNDSMMHRTPVLCNLVPGSIRRFFYIPFRALDQHDNPVRLVPPSHVVWTPYRSEQWIVQCIVSELMEHHVPMDMKGYILYGRSLLSLPWSEDLLSERPNWLFDDPDDY